MKLYITLIVTALAMAFVTGHYSLMMGGQNFVAGEDQQAIDLIRSQFQRDVPPRLTFNLNATYYTKEHFQLLAPLYSLGGPLRDEDKDVFATSGKCFEQLSKLLNTQNYEKVWIWEEFRCGQRVFLPENFFSKPPFLHPSGRSYAYLAYLTGQPHFRTVYWINSNLAHFHVGELELIKKSLPELYPPFNVLESLNSEEVSSLAKGKTFIITKHFVLSRANFNSVYSALEYRLYERRDFERYLRLTAYNIVNYRPGGLCLVQDDNICWTYSGQHLFDMANNSGIFFFYSSLLFIALVIGLLLNKIKTQKNEDQRKRLALQVLTHEFRTPVASMLVLSESLGQKYDQFDSDTQDLVLRLAGEIHRLNRLVQTTRNYLRIKQGPGLVDPKWTKIPSINEFIGHLLEEFDDQVKLHPLEKDNCFVLDSYWLGICLKNIIENAFSHGAPPVEVFLHLEGQTLDVMVQDAGKVEFAGLEVMSAEFIRGQGSSGTGLGLNIVRKVLKGLGGDLIFSSNPTRFTLRLKNYKGRYREVE